MERWHGKSARGI